MKSDYRKETPIKNLKNHIKPTVVRDSTRKVLSVGMVHGQRYWNYDKTKGELNSSNIYNEVAHNNWGQLNYYKNDIGCLIDAGHIYIPYVKPEVKKVDQTQEQTSLF